MFDDQQGEDTGEGGGMTDDLMSRGREMLSDPQNQERLRNVAEERFGIGGGGEGADERAADEGAGGGGVGDVSGLADAGGESDYSDQSG